MERNPGHKMTSWRRPAQHTDAGWTVRWKKFQGPAPGSLYGRSPVDPSVRPHDDSDVMGRDANSLKLQLAVVLSFLFFFS